MTTTATNDAALAGDPSVDEGPVFQRRRMPEDAEIDMTPMIDCVFLLNIFFILTFNADPAQSALLARSMTGNTVDPQTAVVVTIAEGPGKTPLVYLGQGKQGSPLPHDEVSQHEILLRYLQDGFSKGKTIFAVTAEASVRSGDVRRVAAVVSEVEGMRLVFPVQEIME